jgi:tRNA A37 threonylcarbamoyladenosine dehydratase
MSQQLINRSPDLKRLRDEGYDVEVQSNYLVVKSVPYVNSKREIKIGTLVSELTLAGDITAKPSTHVVMFAGDHPCHKDGSEMVQIKHSSAHQSLGEDLSVDHTFSSKPQEGYADYYEKMTTYVAIISSPAQSLDPKITAMTFPVIESKEDESVFNYIDTASSRAGINEVTSKLELGKVAIVGVGGTGSYVLDLIAKTPIKEIHLFDGDKFSQHNAFRSPGAPSLEELRQEPLKVNYLKERYSNMHKHITANNFYIDASNVDQLRGMDFVFLCLDGGEAKKLIVDKLEEFGISFVDVGMGINLVDGSLLGILRVTSSTDKKRDHVKEKKRIPFSDGNGNNDYAKNIQIADLNALNAALAVVKWKKLCGFYHDLENEHFSTYTIDGNVLTNEDRP